jgi:hypothetical protein
MADEVELEPLLPPFPLLLQSLCPVLSHEADSCLGQYSHLIDIQVFGSYQEPRAVLSPGPRARRVDASLDRGQVEADLFPAYVHSIPAQPTQP